MTVKPISPSDIVSEKAKNIPDTVIQTFNTMITKYFSSGKATFGQEELIEYLVDNEVPKENIFKFNWLNVEPIFEAAGWEIKFEKGDGGGDSYFTFTPKVK